ncbi:hypothetical protein [Streptomyces sp. NPDC053048]|uniref:hypothetical protein n=1 Tax=Streptomyces sp. NPDC053048 TaxID=3365694 RepID=UPI0037D08691
MSRPAVPDPTWWLADPGSWELLAFDGGYDSEGIPYDTAWQDRQAVLAMLMGRPGAGLGYGNFARYLLEQEIRFHRNAWGYSNRIGMAALLVAEQRRLEDVWLLWEAKAASFDTYCGLPEVLLIGNGLARTTSYVRDSDRPQRDRLLEYLGTLPPTVTDDVVAEKVTRLRQRYREMGDTAPGD